MKNERTANEAIADYNAKEWEQRQAWLRYWQSLRSIRSANQHKRLDSFLNFLRWHKMKIKTNNQPRDILSWYDLTPAEREEFDYLYEGEGSFVRYKGWVYDLGEAMLIENIGQWQGCYSGTAFSGVLVRYTSDFEQVIVGMYFS